MSNQLSQNTTAGLKSQKGHFLKSWLYKGEDYIFNHNFTDISDITGVKQWIQVDVQ